MVPDEAGVSPLTPPVVSGASGDAPRAQQDFVDECFDRAQTSALPTPASSSRPFLDLLEEVGPQGVAAQWKDRLDRLETIASELRASNEELLATLPENIAQVHRRTSDTGAHLTALFEMLDIIGHPDSNLRRECSQGFPLAGVLPISHLWPELPETQPTLTVEELTQMVRDLKQRLPRQSRKARPEDFEIWEQTLSEWRAGRLSKPRKATRKDFRSRRTLTKRFGVSQLTSKGKLKIRTIDDFTFSGVNLATVSLEALHHDSVDDLIALASNISRLGYAPVMLKADFKGAYRACPVLEEHSVFADVLVSNPRQGGQRYVCTQRALPFGAVASVYGWERLGAALTAVLRWIGLPVLRYVDDLFSAVPEELGDLARSVMERAIAALGYTLEPDKTEGPASSLTVLGVQLLIIDLMLTVAPDPLKVPHWIHQLEEALRTRRLHSGSAAKLAGRLNFASLAIFGRLASAPLRRVYRHQHGRSSVVDDELAKDIARLRDLLVDDRFRRTVPLSSDFSSKYVLFTDAEGSGGAGFVLYHNSTSPDRWGHTLLDASALPLEERLTQITAFELLTPLWALQHLKDLASAQLDLYVDNSAAQHILRKGASGSQDLNQFAEQFWTLVASRNLSLRVFRVPSKLNVADAASRFLTDAVPPLNCSGIADSCSPLMVKTTLALSFS